MNLLAGLKKQSTTLHYKCEYCGKLFAKESTLQVHVCEQKRRHFAKDEKHVRAALRTYQRFYEISANSDKVKTFEEFASSPYYTAFIKFGSFIVNTNPIYPTRFIDFVIKSGVKLDHWCKDELYAQYISQLIKIEPADGALQRTLDTMITWGTTNNAPWEHYFNYVNTNRATHDIVEGMISPWVILNSNAGKQMLNRLSDEQLDMVSLMVDPSFWISRFKQLPADVILVKEVLKEAKIP